MQFQSKQVVEERAEGDERQEAPVPPSIEYIARNNDKKILQPQGSDLPIEKKDDG
jgi:hypothetical protein